MSALTSAGAALAPRMVMLGLTALAAAALPLPAGSKPAALGLLAAGGAAALLRVAVPWWGAAGAALVAAWLAGLPEVSFFRFESWCLAACLAAGALLLWKSAPALPVFFLNLLLLAGTTFSPEGAPPAVLLVLAVLAWMMALEAAFLPPGVRLELRAGLASMLRLAAPVGAMVVFFSLLLPGREDIESASGFSGAGILEAGAFGRVRLSAEPAFRAHFEEPVAPRNLYWRGDVLEENAGFTWRRLRPAPPIAAPQPQLEILDPALTRAPALEPPEFAPETLEEGMREALLAVPRTVAADPLVKSFTKSLDTSSTPAALESLRRALAEGGFTYSLRPGRIGRLQVGRFLGETRTGFCEHYAAASANVLRAAGIPARVVAGFRGGSWNPWTRILTVRALHAHAWVEAWDPAGSRWVRFDPTDAVTTELSLRDAAEWNPGRWSAARRLAMLWEAWVDTAPILAYGLLFGLAGLGLAAATAGLRLASTRREDPAEKLLRSLEKKTGGRRELRRRTGEAPLSWMRRVAAAHPSQAAWWEAAARRYEALAYARPGAAR